MAGLKQRFARRAYRVERGLERVFRGRATGKVIEPYIGYATPDTYIARGRVLTSLRRATPDARQSRWVNLRQMMGLFLTHEVADITVCTMDGSVEAVSDGEGYVSVVVPRGDWTGPIRVMIRGAPDSAVDLPVIVPGLEARLGVISDIDDTLLETGAYSLWRNLWTSMTGNALTRQVHADAVALITALHDGHNPVYYVSSSPWNLHDFLQAVFQRAGLVQGPVFLRDFGMSDTQFLTGSHGDHKGAAIDTILNANPDLPFVLIGDTGQHDAEVYLEAATRHPGRIARVILRAPGPGADASDLHFVERLRELEVPVFVGADYADMVNEIKGAPRAVQAEILEK